MNHDLDFNAAASELWRRIVNVPNSAVFGDSHPDMRMKGNDFDQMPQPGFVGRSYRPGGLLLIGKNPGNDRVKGIMSDPDQTQYVLLKGLKESSGGELAVKAFEDLMTALSVSVMPEWAIFKNVVRPLLDGLGLSLDQISYSNMMKFHTKSNEFSKLLFERSWEITSEQIRLLDPSVIVVLGISTSDQFAKYYRDSARVYKIARGIGDVYLPAAGAEHISKICAAERQHLNIGS
jgi:hypothetical protein